MSLREKAREVKAAGEAERGNFTPSGAPLKVYQYWLRNTSEKNKPKTENFCHFWRVVVFWAPFMALRRSVVGAGLAIAESTPAMAGLAIAALVAAVFLGITFEEVGIGFLIAFGFAYTIAGLILGAIYADEKYKAETWTPNLDWGDTEADRPVVENGLRWGAWITGLVSWFSYGVVEISNRVDTETLAFIQAALSIVVGGGVVLFFLYLGWTEFGLWLLAYIVAAIAIVALAVVLVIAIGEGVESLRAYLRDRPVKVKISVDSEEIDSVKEPKEPGKVSKFFSGIADFLILAAQVARVKKWKICPIVTVPSEPEEDFGAPA